MNYQHSFHAGNAADVMKHLVFLGVLRALQQKSAPYLALDTHAAAGIYDLDSDAARRTGEFHAGVGQMWALRNEAMLPSLVKDWLDIVAIFNSEGELRRYPGSPAIALSAARAQDQLVFVEKLPDIAAQLKSQCGSDARVAVHVRDGYTALQALLPPRACKRGVVLIDPPYEDKADFALAAEAVPAIATRWPSGIFLLWYPITSGGEDQALVARIRDSGVRKILQAEWCWNPCRLPGGMNGSGMLIVNPPWKLQEQLDEVLPWLHARLAADPGMGEVCIKWCVPE